MGKKNKRAEPEAEAEPEVITTKKKKKKKQKKDKWGQPVIVDQNEPLLEEDGVVGNPSNGDVDEAEEAVEGAATDNEEHDKHTIVVSGMPYITKEEEIREMFNDCGPISRLEMTTFPDTGNFKGLAFVRFETEDGAKSALALDGMKMGDRFVKIELCRISPKMNKKPYKDPPAKVDGCLSAYIGNLSWDVSEDDIRQFFKDSKIKSIKLALNKATSKCRGFGHVFFFDDESLENAMKKNQKKLCGRPIKIAYSVNY